MRVACDRFAIGPIGRLSVQRLLVCTSIIWWLGTAVAAAQTPCTWGPGGTPGTPDCRFGGGTGIVTTATPGGLATASDVVVQPDGKLVLSGYGRLTPSGSGVDFMVFRYNADGSPDTSFGTNGRASVVMDPVDHLKFANAVALQSVGNDLRILVGGQAYVSGKGKSSTIGFAVARFTSTGSLDTTFGAGGKLVFSPTGVDTSVADVVVQCDQRILLVGGLSVARLTVNGTLDTTFGPAHTGVVTVSGITGGLYSGALQSTGPILPSGCPTNQQLVAAGYLDVQITKKTSSWDMLVSRFTSTGAVDQTFGTSGLRTIDFVGQKDRAWSVTVDSSNRIVGAGIANPGVDFGVFRLTASGQLDQTFGGGTGKVTTDFNQWENMDAHVITDAQGRIVVGGDTAPQGDLSQSDFMIVRYNDDGTRDTTFGTGGISVVDVGASDGSGAPPAVDSLGRIIIVGGTGGNLVALTALNP